MLPEGVPDCGACPILCVESTLSVWNEVRLHAWAQYCVAFCPTQPTCAVGAACSTACTCAGKCVGTGAGTCRAFCAVGGACSTSTTSTSSCACPAETPTCDSGKCKVRLWREWACGLVGLWACGLASVVHPQQAAQRAFCSLMLSTPLSWHAYLQTPSPDPGCLPDWRGVHGGLRLPRRNQ